MENSFRELLEQQKLLPYKNSNWDELTINHSKDSNRIVERSNIRTQFKNVENGVYIYTNKMNSEVLYVGEGNLKDRLKRHYEKSYKKEIKKNLRYEFFSSDEQKIEMLVFYTELVNVYERRAIEAMLITVLKPKYNLLLNENNIN